MTYKSRFHDLSVALRMLRMAVKCAVREDGRNCSKQCAFLLRDCQGYVVGKCTWFNRRLELVDDGTTCVRCKLCVKALEL